ncbi:hypothetical protein [Candidatus Stoquefichus sp. SB1]|uniref:hypothetical protein n=1 Tax=Candidatus Stoquefichus sp. SB1 TaxID=1658109 RepID=UPI0012FF2003|nr:hypothetical protein [Candidatus Stoquefichus sp. SB1]
MIKTYKLILEDDENRILEEDEVLEEILEDISNMYRRIMIISSKVDKILEKSNERF